VRGREELTFCAKIFDASPPAMPVHTLKSHEMRVELIRFEIAAARHRIVHFLDRSRNDLSDSS
jgi:hypothetical protein